ncbi:hypothetical protein PAXINDRAFT_172466 [Paxillus involutus ATCC 200175]|uniref:Uncharacterized protein n=1 Tax=Paxillus involutus ATCC 200175 TaxID=664439 RepID=A0A0C9TP09_PAXIN|nr:hypothetical protein PAXINDRAFT_172466 [Paxillus involutus ATCC 200175]
MTTSESFALMRGPTYLGFTVALVLYGAGIGQLIRYVRAFPSDKLHVKLLFITLMQYWVTFMVQVFYAHRVWIMILDDIIRTPTLDTLTFSRYTPWAAIASATCDAIITSSVFYYLRPARTGVTRYVHHMHSSRHSHVSSQERKRFQATESRVHSDGLAVFHQRASDGGPSYVNSMLAV